MEMGMEIFCRNGEVGLERMLASVMEAIVVEAVLAAGKSVMWLLLAMGSLSNELTLLPRKDDIVNERDAVAILSRSTPKTAPENKDDGETDDDEDEDDEDAEEQDDDGGEDDLSGDEGNNEGDEDDPDDDVEANGEGGSDDDDEDDEDEDDDEDGEDEDEDDEEDEEEDEEEEIPQPPAKKRK